MNTNANWGWRKRLTEQLCIYLIVLEAKYIPHRHSTISSPFVFARWTIRKCFYLPSPTFFSTICGTKNGIIPPFVATGTVATSIYACIYTSHAWCSNGYRELVAYTNNDSAHGYDKLFSKVSFHSHLFKREEFFFFGLRRAASSVFVEFKIENSAVVCCKKRDCGIKQTTFC